MKVQNYERKRQVIQLEFEKLKQEHPERCRTPLKFSWSNWGFGREPFHQSCSRLAKAGIQYIELQGNHFSNDLGYRAKEILPILQDYGLKVSGTCGLFSPERDLSSNSPVQRQAAIDYLRREIAFAAEVGGEYIIIVPGAVGRTQPYDDSEFDRSVETLCMAADLFRESGVKAAIEPIRSAETSFIHTIDDAKKYIKAVGHTGIQHINADVYHMQSEESHIGESILSTGEQLVNLHIADSNRSTLGTGSMDIDCIIMSLYLLDFNNRSCYVTAEPLGPGGDPYPAMYGKPDPMVLDQLVFDSIAYFREREKELQILQSGK
jgi:sugar phosphate isomerase/epimerase